MGAATAPTSTPIKIDKGRGTGPGPTPIKIGKSQTPTPAPIKIIKMQVSTPTPTPGRMIKNLGTSTPSPVSKGGGRPGPIKINPTNVTTPTPTPTWKSYPDASGPKVSKEIAPGPGGRPGPITTAPSTSKKLIPGDANPAPPPPGTGTGPGQKLPDQKVPVVDENTPTSRNTDTPKDPRGYANTLSSKLAVYTQDGKGVAQTNLSGEFPSKLETTATVNQFFAVRWSREKAGPAETGNLQLTKQGSTVPLGSAESVTIPAQSTAVNAEFTMPGVPPATYELRVSSASGTSNLVRLFYAGESVAANVSVPAPSGGPLPNAAPSAHRVTHAEFTPMTGYPKQAGYTKPQLTLTLESDDAWSISEILVEVYSGPYKSGEILTASGGAEKSPKRLFVKTWKIPSTSYTVSPGKPRVIKIVLPNTVKGEPDGPGIENSEEWGLAYGQTTDASFRWSVDGGTSSIVDKPLKQAWQWP